MQKKEKISFEFITLRYYTEVKNIFNNTRFRNYCMITYDDFSKVDIRVGTIITVDDFPEARKPAYKLTIDFGGELGTKKSSAQITHYYKKEELIGRQVICVVNFPPRQIGPFMSEVLTLGLPDEQNNVVLLQPSHQVPNGGKLF